MLLRDQTLLAHANLIHAHRRPVARDGRNSHPHSQRTVTNNTIPCPNRQTPSNTSWIIVLSNASSTEVAFVELDRSAGVHAPTSRGLDVGGPAAGGAASQRHYRSSRLPCRLREEDLRAVSQSLTFCFNGARGRRRSATAMRGDRLLITLRLLPGPVGGAIKGDSANVTISSALSDAKT